MLKDVLDYYRAPGPITSLEKYRAFTDSLPADPGALYQVAQGLIVHDMWVGSYGVEYRADHEYPQVTAWMEDILDKALELDGRSLAIPRPAERRVIACCREFATLFAALLRAKGIPARSRCGFAAYFGWGPNYEDHWVTECWNGSRWVWMDPQLDPLQQSLLQGWSLGGGEGSEERRARVLAFTPRDLKPGEFLVAGEAWRRCRSGELDHGHFGIGCPIRPEWGIDSLYGLWFVRGQLLRDFAALNKVETVPYLLRICKKLDWSAWRLVGARDGELTAADLALLDEIAELCCDADGRFEDIRRAYESNVELQAPEEIIRR